MTPTKIGIVGHASHGITAATGVLVPMVIAETKPSYLLPFEPDPIVITNPYRESLYACKDKVSQPLRVRTKTKKHTDRKKSKAARKARRRNR